MSAIGPSVRNRDRLRKFGATRARTAKIPPKAAGFKDVYKICLCRGRAAAHTSDAGAGTVGEDEYGELYPGSRPDLHHAPVPATAAVAVAALGIALLRWIRLDHPVAAARARRSADAHRCARP